MRKRSILLTRTAEQNKSLIEKFDPKQFDCIDFPLIKIIPIELSLRDQLILKTLANYKMVIFTSHYAVMHSIQAITHYFAQKPTNTTFCAIGDKTARALKDYHSDILIPEEFNSEALLALPQLAHGENQEILIIKGEGGRNLLQPELVRRGFKVDTIDCYKRSRLIHDMQALRERWEQQSIDYLLVTSNTNYDYLHKTFSIAMGQRFFDPIIVSLSKRISAYVKQHGHNKIIVTTEPSDEAIVKALIR